MCKIVCFSNPEHLFAKSLLYVVQMPLTGMCAVRHGIRTYGTNISLVFDSLRTIARARPFITSRRIESSTIPIKYQLD